MTATSTLLGTVAKVDVFTTLGTVVALLSSYVFYNTYFYPTFLSPLRRIPGPPNKSKFNPYRLPFLGNFIDILKDKPGVAQGRWIQEYGGIVRYHDLFGRLSILLADPSAIHHVFNQNAYGYKRPPRFVRMMAAVIGTQNVFLAEGDVHKRQRKMVVPPFGHKHIKEMLPLMDGPSQILSGIWQKLVNDSETGEVEFNIMTDLSHVTLDMIGLAGFGYDFQSLTNPTNVMGMAYKELFDHTSPILQILRTISPMFGKIPIRPNQHHKHAVSLMNRATKRMIDEKIAHARSVKAEDDVGLDLMSVMVRANEHSDLPESEKMSTRELQDQILTFLAAGHETTALSTTWILHALSIDQKAQRRLRNELFQAFGSPGHKDSKPLTYDGIHALPYLNACVKEILRCHPPVPATSRVAARDDEILGYFIPEGTTVIMPLIAIHRMKSVWGEDADEFKPERWMDPETVAKEDPELASRTKFVTPEMTWAYQPFITGPRNCPGTKFALLEFKVLLYHLLINLEYHPAPGFKFVGKAMITYRPYPGMRLLIKRYNHDAHDANESRTTAATARAL
ncbi:hypothetical protein BGZ83_010993 [Gryganskiella cystojenkinii]|nr:hypothetical protein BGZ83_010993 [Gryganskiella cystojenkinii]